MPNIIGHGGVLGKKRDVQEWYECHETFIFHPVLTD